MATQRAHQQYTMIRAIVRVRGGKGNSIQDNLASESNLTAKPSSLSTAEFDDEAKRERTRKGRSNVSSVDEKSNNFEDEPQEAFLQMMDETKIRIHTDDHDQSSREFEFTRCFGSEVTQDEFYKDSGVEDLINHALSGYAATLFTYGATGSGKTYTTFGCEGVEGCFGNAVRTIFQLLDTSEFQGTSVKMSSVEIYNDRLQDLLTQNTKLDSTQMPGLKWSAREQGFVLKNVRAINVDNCARGLACLRKTMRRRQVSAHALNDRSSRSHCITILFLENQVTGKYGKIMFCDLAGSERIKRTDSQNAKESGGLNKSLFTLSKVVRALDNKNGPKPPYRDSALTKLLCSSLGGCSMCMMIACVSPQTNCLSESMRTLRFAARTMRIKNTPIIFRSKHDRLVEKLRTQIRELTVENEVLRQRVEELCTTSDMTRIQQDLLGQGRDEAQQLPLMSRPAVASSKDSLFGRRSNLEFELLSISERGNGMMNEVSSNLNIDASTSSQSKADIVVPTVASSDSDFQETVPEVDEDNKYEDDFDTCYDQAMAVDLDKKKETQTCSIERANLYDQSSFQTSLNDAQKFNNMISQGLSPEPIGTTILGTGLSHSTQNNFSYFSSQAGTMPDLISQQQNFQEGLFQALFTHDHEPLAQEIKHRPAFAGVYNNPLPVPRAPSILKKGTKSASPRIRKLSAQRHTKGKTKKTASRLRVRALRDEVESKQVQQVVSNWITHHRTRYSNDFVF